MRLNRITFFSILAAVVMLNQPVSSAPGGGPGPGPDKKEPPKKADGPQMRLQVKVLENFEESEDWRARSTTPLGQTKIRKMVQRGPIASADNPDEAPASGPDGDQCDVNKPECSKTPNHILGVKTYFYNRGFDRVEVKPPHEFIIKGKARQFSMWVLGRRYRHTLSIKLRDYRGKLHKLPLGRLNYYGWRKLTVTIPGWLPQSTRFSMLDKNLQFVSFYVTSDVHEIGGNFYFYVDNLKVLVDRSESNYPGSEIKDNW